MVLKADQVRVKALLAETITLLCKNGLHFKAKFSIQALIGITLDEEDVFLVNINETIESKDSVPDDNEDNSSFEQQPLAGKRLRGTGTRAASGPSPSPASPSVKSLGGNSSIPKIPSNSQTRSTRVSRQTSPHSVAATRSSEVVAGKQPVETSIAANVGVFGSANDSIAELASDSLPAASLGLPDSGGGVTFPAISIKNDSQSNDTSYDDSKPLPEESDLPEEPSSKRIRLQTSDSRLEPSVATPSSSEVNANFTSSGEPTKSEPADVIEIKEESYSDSESQLPNYSAYGDYNAAVYGGANPDMTHAFGETSMFQAGSGFFVQPSGEGEQTSEDEEEEEQEEEEEGGVGSHPIYRCSKCSTFFKSALNLSQHDKFVHRQSFSFVCPICGKGSRGRGDLRGHMATQHNGPRDFKCHVCAKEFAYKQHLFAHIRQVHKN